MSLSTLVIPAPVISPPVRPLLPRRQSFHADFAMAKKFLEQEKEKKDEDDELNNRGGVRRRASVRKEKYTK